MPRARAIKYPTGVRPAPPHPQTGATRWQIRWRHEGREHLVLVAADTAAEAAAERTTRIRLGAAYGVPRRNTLTVQRAVEQFLPTREVPATRVQDSGNLRRLVEQYGDRTLGSLTTADLRVWLDGLRPIGAGRAGGKGPARYDPGTLRGFRRSVRALYHWAVERGHADSNPARDVVVPPRARPRGPAPAARKKHLEIHELRALFGWLADHANPAHALLFRTQLRLGLRISEVCTLRVELVDLRTGVVEIDRAISQSELSPGKKGKRVTKYLSKPGRDELRDWLAAHPPRDGYVVTKPPRIGERWPFYAPRHIRKSFNAALSALGGFGLDPHTTTHALRHSWSRVAEHYSAELGPETLAQLLGNTPGVARSTYSRGPGLLARAIADHLDEVVFA